MFSWMGRVGLMFCLVGLVAACNADGDAPLTDDHQEPTSCTSDEDCDSGLCLADAQVCAATCEDTCDGDLACTEGLCLPADYCDEGFGPGCAPTTCEPGCHADATCNLEATGGPSCACNPGFEGDGLDCTIVETNPCLTDNGGCGDPELVQCDAMEGGEDGELVAECTTINPCLEDNGGCGDAAFFACTHTAVGEAECSAIDPCLSENGGCGDAEFFQCDAMEEGESGRLIAECSVIDPCLSENGGCGVPEYFQCDAIEDIESGGLLAECSAIDPCLSDNGGCGVPEYFQCDAMEEAESGRLLAECSAIDPCLTDNGGCGAAEYFQCDAIEDAEGGHLVAECSAIDPCLTDNGGCGDPALVQCDAIEDAEGGHLVAECITINPCLSDNGGCGAPEFFTCTNTEVGVGECADVDLCADDNGGCGDPALHRCVLRSGELPLCRLAIETCTYDYEAPLLHDVFVTNDVPNQNFNREFLTANPSGYVFDFSSGLYPFVQRGIHMSLLQFDLSALPSNATIHDAAFYFYAFDNVREGGVVDVQLPYTESPLDLASITWLDARSLSYYPLLNSVSFDVISPGEVVETAFSSSRLNRVAEEGKERGELTLALGSFDATARFFSSEHPEQAYHPRLELQVQACFEQVNPAQESAMVSAFFSDRVFEESVELFANSLGGDEFYLRFDFSGVPANAQIVDVRLTLHPRTVWEESNLMLDALTEPWEPGVVTYNTRPASTGVPLDTATLANGSREVVEMESDALFAHVLERFEAGQTVDLRVSALQGDTAFHGSEALNTALRPRLTVVYE
ncbi:DNRLRE domain-containing protein [Bradymonadales bacterium TMQ1]|nr:DNRLRE domain-containing protein [Bradymonadales bacterium TMQ1]